MCVCVYYNEGIRIQRHTDGFHAFVKLSCYSASFMSSSSFLFKTPHCCVVARGDTSYLLTCKYWDENNMSQAANVFQADMEITLYSKYI